MSAAVDQASEEAARKLRALEEALAGAAGDRGASLALHRQSAQICLGQTPPCRERAARHLRQALALDSADEALFGLLVRALAPSPGELSRAYTEAAAGAPPRLRAERLLAAAALHEGQGESDAAAACRRRALEVPGEGARGLRLRAATELAATYRAAGHWLDLAAVLELAGRDEDGVARERRLAERARILADRTSVPGDAWLAWRSVLELRANHPAALEFAQRHLLAVDQPAELAQTLANAAGATATPLQAARLWREAGRLWEERVRDLEAARRAYAAAWRLDPQDGAARAALKRLLALAGDWRGYRGVLEREARQLESPDEKIEAYRELAAFYRQVLRDDQAAGEVYALVLQLAPGDPEALAARVEIFEALGDDAALTAALERQLQARPDPAACPGLRQRLCEALRRRGHTRAAAEQLVLAFAEVEPGDAARAALARCGERLRDAAERAGDRVSVAKVLEAEGAIAAAAAMRERAGDRAGARRLWRRADDAEALERLDHRPDPAQREIAELAAAAEHAPSGRAGAALRFRLAQIFAAAEPPQRDAARAELARALELHPAGTHAFDLLERLLRVDQAWDQLAELYRSALADAREEVRRVELYARLARVEHEHRGDPTLALGAWESLLAIEPTHPEARQALATLYRETGQPQKLVRLLEHELARAAGETRRDVLAQLGALLAGPLTDETAALARYRELLQIDPAHPDALAYCRARAEAAGAWSEVAEMLGRAADAAPQRGDRAERHRELARLCQEQLGDRDRAALAWRRVCDLSPDDEQARAALRQLLGELGRFGELAQAVRQELQRVLLPQSRVPLFELLAEVERDRLGNAQAAVEALWAAVQSAPDHKPAYDALADLLEQQGQHRDLAILLRRRLALAEATTERVAVLRRLARALGGPLAAIDEAVTAYREILALLPGDDGACAALRDIYVGREAWQELAVLLRETLAVIGKDTAREATLRLELGRLLEQRLAQPEEAAREYERGLTADHKNAELGTQLGALYESTGSWDKLIETIRRQAASGGAGLAQALVDIGRVYDQRMSDGTRAREAYEQAIHLDPKRRDALAALRSLAERRGDWREAVALARREERLSTDPHERAALLLAAGAILADKLDRPARAAEALEEALRADPSHLEALERLGDLYFAQNELDRTLPLYERLLAAGAAANRRHELFHRLGLAAERAGDGDRAFGYYIQSFNYDSGYEPTLTRLVELCFERRQWENTVRVGEAVAQACADRVAVDGERPRAASARAPIIHTQEELAELYHRMGLAELHIGQRGAALRLLPELVLGPGGRSVLPELAWRDVAEVWGAQRLEPRLLAAMEAVPRRRAETALSRCLTLRPQHIGALSALAALALARARWDEALAALDRCVDVHDLEKSRRVELLVVAGDICACKTHDRQRAERYYRRALALTPGHPGLRKKLDDLKVAPTPPTT
jgi:tetratricopeptide (TPR) repeat protein